MTRTLPVACNRDCGGGCPLVATVEGGRVVRIANNPAGGPFLKGCVRGYRAYLQQQSPDRLTTPLIRTGERGSGQFREAGWDEALGLVASRLTQVVARHGNDAVVALGGSGSCRGALHNTDTLTARFLNLLGGHVELSNSYSSAAASYVEPVVLGTNKAGVDPATLQHSEMIVLWGANLVDCIMGCEWRGRVREAKRRGVPVVVIDPRRTETAKQLGTEWLPVLPGTDSALMMSLLYVLVTESLVDEAFAAAHATGWELLRRRVLGEDSDREGEEPDAGDGVPSDRASAPTRSVCALPPGRPATPEWAEGVCGTPAARIVALARDWARRRPTALVPGLSIQRTWGGEEAVRLAIALQVATGDLGRLGGSSGARTWNGLPEPRFEGIAVPANPVTARLPENDWADAILTGRAGGHPSDIRAALNVGGNYIAQAADVHKSIRAFRALEFSVCHDLFLTATAKHCDVVLPVTHWLERDDVVFTTANYLLYSHRVVDLPQSGGGVGKAGMEREDGRAAPSPRNRAAGPRHDLAIFTDLARRMGLGDAFTEGRDEDAWLRELIERSEIPDGDEFRAVGVYIAPDQERVRLAAFAADPARYPLATPSGKVELAGAACVAAGLSEVPEARVRLPEGPEARAGGPVSNVAFPLRLVTPKSRFRVHSQLDDIPWFRARDDRSLWMNPLDAAARGIVDGAQVLVASAQGRVRCACRVTADVMPGVVSLCEGIEARFEPAPGPGGVARDAATTGAADGGEAVDVAGAANVLTSDRPTLPSRGATMHSALVDVESSV